MKDTPSEEDVNNFSGRVFSAILGAQLVQAAYLGDKLGWYRTLAEHGPLSPEELAAMTDSSERYAREFLEFQTVSGWISCQDPKASPRKFSLPPAQAEVLANRDSLNYMLPLCTFQAGLGKSVEAMSKAYKMDGGVSWAALGNDQRSNQAAANRPFYLKVLGHEILKGIPEVRKALSSGGRVADIGAGYAWSSIGVAQAFPECKVDAYDLDKPSIEEAKKNIMEAKLEDRVQALCKDAATAQVDEPYDLVLALECVHDMSDPISVLKTMRELASGQGTVIVMDEKSEEEFTGKTDNPVEQLLYGFSCTCCLADSKSGGPNSAATGAVMRPSVLKAYAQQAGFKTIEILPVDHDFWRFYKLIDKQS